MFNFVLNRFGIVSNSATPTTITERQRLAIAFAFVFAPRPTTPLKDDI